MEVMVKNKKVDLEEVYSKAKGFAPNIMCKYKLSSTKFSTEDIVSAFFVKFMEGGFHRKYDSSKSTLGTYVYTGVRNIAISMAKKVKREVESLEDIVSEDSSCDYAEGAFLSCDLEHTFMEDILLEEAIARVKYFTFYGVSTIIDGRVYLTNSKSVVLLLYRGYTVREIAKIFSVCLTTIRNVLRKIRSTKILEYLSN